MDIPDIVSGLIIIIAITINLFIAKKAYKSYRENREVLMLIIAFASVFIICAMILLTCEQIFLMEDFKNEFLGVWVFGGTAMTLSGFAVVTFDLFAFKMVFPKQTVILTILASVATTVYIVFWWLNPKVAPLTEIVFLPFPGLGYSIVPILNYTILIPLFSIPIFILLYHAIKARKESPIASKRSAILGLGGLALATAYTVELLGLDPWITMIFRVLFPSL
ncbi:MAG: hypothetical protein ACTSRC_13655 [Candidatus Helarchaeota archaeon]